MAFIKSEIQVKDILKGDIFRLIESVGNLKQTFEYEVVSNVMGTQTMHVGDSGATRQVDQCIVRVKNRKNGAGKTKKYNPETVLTVWRTV
jgi:hypothetical protein